MNAGRKYGVFISLPIVHTPLSLNPSMSSLSAWMAIKDGAVLINTKTPNYIVNHPELYVCEVVMAKSDYGFLDHNSVVDCTSVYDFHHGDFQGSHRAAINDQSKLAILQAILKCPRVEKRHKDVILKREAKFLEEHE